MMNRVQATTKPTIIEMGDIVDFTNAWPMGYCERGGYKLNGTEWSGHYGEHPLYTDSDGGCINFVSSERLLEIKQLFDAAIEIEELKLEIEDLRLQNTLLLQENEEVRYDLNDRKKMIRNARDYLEMAQKNNNFSHVLDALYTLEDL